MENKAEFKPSTNTFVFEIADLKQPVDINDISYLIVNEKQVESLLAKIKESKEDIQKLKSSIVSVLDILGLYDHETNGLKESIKTGEESYFSHILKALSEIITLVGQAQMPGIGKKAEEKLLKKFEFIKEVLPLIEKHG